MKTNLPTAISSTDHFLLCAQFYQIKYTTFYVSFEDLPETCEERLTLELSASESL